MNTWQSVMTIAIARCRCPHCGSLEPPHIVRSLAGGDGSTTRRCICRRCSVRFLLVIDPDVWPEVLPATGSDELPT